MDIAQLLTALSLECGGVGCIGRSLMRTQWRSTLRELPEWQLAACCQRRELQAVHTRWMLTKQRAEAPMYMHLQ